MRMQMTAKRRATAGFAVLFVLFVALVLLQLVVGDRLQAGRAARSQRTESTRDANRAILQYMTDAETGVRGFQLTGEKRFLEPYDSGRVGAFTAMEQVDATADDAGVRRLLTAERQAAVHWLYAYAIPIVNSGVADADQPRADRGREMFNLIRTANADADAAIATEREAEDAAAARAAQLAQLVFALLAAAILVIGLVLAVLHQRQLLEPVEHIRQTLRRLADGDLAARAVPAGPGEMRTLIRILNDLAAETERLQGRQARLISELRILDEQKDVFVATVTHELRTPLTSILGYTEVLADGSGGELSPVQRRGVSAILRNAHRLEATVGDLLLLDRGGDRTGRPAVPVDLAVLATGLHADLGPAARAKDLGSTLQAASAWVSGDAAHLERALRNLMENAIKFTPAGGSVDCRVAADGDRAVVTVTDTGIGIPADDVPGLFTPFHRAANAMRLAVQGNGLGLAIVRNIVTEHGGSVAASSELDRGSTFTLTLPAVAPGSEMAGR